jgi:hypothetical protein
MSLSGQWEGQMTDTLVSIYMLLGLGTVSMCCTVFPLILVSENPVLKKVPLDKIIFGTIFLTCAAGGAVSISRIVDSIQQ